MFNIKHRLVHEGSVVARTTQGRRAAQARFKGWARLAIAVPALVAGLWSKDASASAQYVVFLQAKLSAEALPPCTTCHTGIAGGPGTVAAVPLGGDLMAVGLAGAMNDQEAWWALVAPVLNTGDADVDGFTNADEIANQGDPNNASIGPGGAKVEPYEYGCIGSNDEPESGTEGTSSISHAAPRGSGLMLTLLLALAAVVVRRRTR
jgi:hypothetical protein